MSGLVPDYGPRTEGVKAVAQGLCKSTAPTRDCYCGGEATRCFALKLHTDKAVSVVLALEAAGLEIRRREK